jgi:hypothetical protein
MIYDNEVNSRSWIPAFAGMTMMMIVLSGCGGTAPSTRADSSQESSGVLIQGRLIMPSGEIREGGMVVNLESEDHQYQMAIAPRQTSLYFVKPGTYRIAPPRGVFGNAEATWTVQFSDQKYSGTFPDALSRHAEYVVRPGKIVSLGIVEARLSKTGEHEKPILSGTLIEDVDSKRELVQDSIRKMGDPKLSATERETAINSSMALQEALVELQGSVKP